MMSHRKGLGGLLALSLVLAAGCNLNVNAPPVSGGSTASPGTSATTSPRPSANPSASASPGASASPTGGEKEDNGDFDKAQTLALATNLSASLGGDTDEKDTFMVAIPAGAQDGNLTITVTESSSDFAPYIRIYADNKAEITGTGADDSTSSPTTLVQNVTAGKSYYFQITGAGEMASYTLRADFTPVADSHERNDTFETAKALTSGTATDLYLFAGRDTNDGSDEDYFTIAVPEGSTGIKVMIDNNSPAEEGQSHYVRLYNAAKEELDGTGASNNQADLDHTFTVEAAGTYYLKIDAANSKMASKLTVTVQ